MESDHSNSSNTDQHNSSTKEEEDKVEAGVTTLIGREIDNVTYGLKSIGRIQSCFTKKNGTPRQGLLAHHAKAILTIDYGLPNTQHALGIYFILKLFLIILSFIFIFYFLFYFLFMLFVLFLALF